MSHSANSKRNLGYFLYFWIFYNCIKIACHLIIILSLTTNLIIISLHRFCRKKEQTKRNRKKYIKAIRSKNNNFFRRSLSLPLLSIRRRVLVDEAIRHWITSTVITANCQRCRSWMLAHYKCNCITRATSEFVDEPSAKYPLPQRF